MVHGALSGGQSRPRCFRDLECYGGAGHSGSGLHRSNRGRRLVVAPVATSSFGSARRRPDLRQLLAHLQRAGLFGGLRRSRHVYSLLESLSPATPIGISVADMRRTAGLGRARIPTRPERTVDAAASTGAGAVVGPVLFSPGAARRALLLRAESTTGRDAA